MASDVDVSLDETKKFEEIVSHAQTALVNKPSLEYFGILSYGLPKKIVAKAAYERIFGKQSLGFTDGKSITYLASDNLNLGDIVFTTIHEILHVISNHVQRTATRDRFMWNLAVDQVVNTILKDISLATKFITFPNTCFFMEDYYQNTEKRYDAAEIIYDYLKKEKNRFKTELIPISSLTPCQMPGQSGGNGNPQDQDGDGGEGDQDGKGKNKKNQKSGSGGNQPSPQTIDPSQAKDNERYVIKVTDTKTGKVSYSAEDSNFGEEDTDEATKAAFKELQENARLAWANSQCISKGDMPGSLLQLLEEMFKVEIPWQEILESAIMYNAQHRQDVTWGWPNEIMRPLGIHLPGPFEEPTPDALVAVVDTSGSVSDEDLKTFIGILCASVAYYDKLIVIVHDYVIQAEIDMGEHPSEEDVFNACRQLPGRGGTSHSGALQRVGELAEEVNLSSVIFLTDYYSDVEYECQKNQWMKEYETIWLLVQRPKDFEVKLNHCETKTIIIPDERQKQRRGY